MLPTPWFCLKKLGAAINTVPTGMFVPVAATNDAASIVGRGDRHELAEHGHVRCGETRNGAERGEAGRGRRKDRTGRRAAALLQALVRGEEEEFVLEARVRRAALAEVRQDDGPAEVRAAAEVVEARVL